MSEHGAESPDLAEAKSLLDDLKAAGFRLERTGAGPDSPLLGHRVSGRWVDTIHLEGFSRDCMAWRQRRSLLVVPGDGIVERRVSGAALSVLGEVTTWETDS